MNFIANLFTTIFNSQLTKNLVNHWTGGGILIAVASLAQAGIIPTSVLNQVTGMNTQQVLPWVIFAIAVWIITHLHIVNICKWLVNRKLNKANQQLALDKLRLEDVQVQRQIKDLNDGK